ncbi:MAG TPA: xanthine dehydrogenase family protein molybdopterin-binding subunit [Candidatus Binataceae bacterium]|nr:xanthine dehydrogenase family protein molybdopterin-binding subunit [Candidatus Binataceae bacterium]
MAASATDVHNYRVIGTRPIRHDGVDKVTGRAKYGADYAFPGMLFGKVLRSPHAHANIKSINVDKALALPGVKAVVTAADLPEAPDRMENAGEQALNLRHLSSNVLARDKVLYDGHAVAAVAAISPHIAEEALQLIEVEYEVLPPVMTVEAAMKPGAPILLPTLRNKEDGPEKQTNVANHLQFKRGDIAEGFKQADFIVEHEFKTAMVHQGYIEPHSAVGLYSADGHGTIYCSTQGTFNVRTLSALVLGIPEGKIKVVPAEIGGGFGGKLVIYLEPLSLLLSKKTGAPVKLTMSRAEVLRATGPTSGSTIRAKIGATKDGKLVAAEIWMAYEAGAFPGSPVGAGAMTIIAQYNIPNFLIDAYDVVVNRPKTAAYRAPGASNAAMASETIVDELADKCGIDPCEFRIMNASHEGTPQVVGPPFKRIGLIETLEAIKNSPHYKSKLEGPYRGRGVACGFWFNAGMQSSATVNIHSDGTVSVVIGSVDVGGTRAAQAMIAAEVLGADINDVRPIVADTDSIGHTDVTGGSRTAFATGWAVYEAAQDALRQLKERAAKVWEKKPEDVIFDNGKFSPVQPDEKLKPMTLKQLAGRFARTGGPIVGRATVSARGVGPAFATTLVDLEVDPDTGKVQVLRATVAQDAGKAIHPAYVEGQMQGGTAQGIGWALNEEYFYDTKGVLRNTGLLDYRMPTCLDMPLIETAIVEVPTPGHPLGIRGVGEVSIVPPPAAVANAIAHATGVRMTQLPMSPPRLLKAILERHAANETQVAAAD